MHHTLSFHMFCTFLKGGGIDCTRSAFVGLAWQAGELEEKYDGFLVSTGETSLLSSGPPGLHQGNLFIKISLILITRWSGGGNDAGELPLN